MLGRHLTELQTILSQIDSAVGIPIPAVTDARARLAETLQATTPQEVEERLAAVHESIRAIAAGAQPPPNSLLAQLLGSVEAHTAMRTAIATGKSVGWAVEPISIDGVEYEVMIGAWPKPTAQTPEAGAPKARAGAQIARSKRPPRRKR